MALACDKRLYALTFRRLLAVVVVHYVVRLHQGILVGNEAEKLRGGHGTYPAFDEWTDYSRVQRSVGLFGCQQHSADLLPVTWAREALAGISCPRIIQKRGGSAD